MIKFIGFYKRKPGISHEEFSHHWKNVHGPLIAGGADVRKYFKRYVQHHLTKDPKSPADLPFDGFSEAWFTSLEARDEFVNLDVIQNQVIPDEHAFLDLSATRWMAIDHQVLQIDDVPDHGSMLEKMKRS